MTLSGACAKRLELITRFTFLYFSVIGFFLPKTMHRSYYCLAYYFHIIFTFVHHQQPNITMNALIKPGVATGDQVQAIFALAKEKGFALPAVNVTSTSTVNAVIEAAAKLNAPAILQFSNGGAQYFAGKGLSNAYEKAAILGGISGAKHIHEVAEAYGATVILHTDHCAKNLLPWIDGLLDAGEVFFAQTGKPLYSSHMIDLSEEPIHENIELCKKYLK